MKNMGSRYLGLLATLLLVQAAVAQIDLQCSGRDKHALYFNDIETGIYRIDSVDTDPSDPILVEDATDPVVIYFNGISINKNLDNGSGDTVMYALGHFNEYLYYENGTWVHTTHVDPNNTASNIGGTDQYIFDYSGLGNVSRYDGSSVIDTVLTGLGFAIADVATDNTGNFYLLFTEDNLLTEYDPNGVTLQSFTTTGNGTIIGGGGMSLLYGKVYYCDALSPVHLYRGDVTGSTINFTIIDTLWGYVPQDFAVCPTAADPLAIAEGAVMPHFKIYPNPASGTAFLKLNNTGKVMLSDLSGKQVGLFDARGLSELQIPLSGYVPGVYLVTATSPNGQVTRGKMVVM